jgi:hypothetical protein
MTRRRRLGVAWWVVVVGSAAARPRSPRRPAVPDDGSVAPIFVNPDPDAAWPRTRNWAPYFPRNASHEATAALCTGRRRSADVIVYLGQKRHSSYDATHANTLNASMASLARHMLKVAESDVIVWHEGDLGPADADASK